MNKHAGKTILVVDDEPDLRTILKEELELVGFKVLTAENGTVAFKIAETENIDVIVSDIRMPNGNGVELLDKINQIRPRFPVLLFMTGYSDLTIEDAYHKGASGILSKPFDPDQLIHLLERLTVAIPDRWRFQPERTEVNHQIKLEIAGIDKIITAEMINIGNGGMFIATDEFSPHVSQMVKFQINFMAETNQSFDGTGVVRWVRNKPTAQYKKGFGLEFQGLDEKNSKTIFDIIEQTKPKSYIPKN